MTGALDPMVVAAVMFSVDREVGRCGQTIARPTGTDLEALYRYWRDAAAIVGEPLALIVAAELPVGALGLASYSLVSQPTLADALASLSETFLGRLVPGMSLRIVPLPREAVEIRLQSEGDAELMPLLEEIVLAVIHRHLTLLTAPPSVRAVTLRRPAPQAPASWHGFFGVRPRFFQRYTALRLHVGDLGLALRTANPEIQTIVREVHTRTGADHTLSAKVRTYIRARLRGALDATTVAAALAVSPRTLQRRLQVEGTSLRELATAVRIEVGCDMLEHGDATISEITQSLGFAQPASFTRAFVAATSETPQAYRKRTRDR